MTLRTRLMVTSAAAVAVVVVLASAGVYVAARSALRGEVDDALSRRLQTVSRLQLELPAPPGGEPLVDRIRLRLPDEPLGGAEGFIQVVGERGAAEKPSGEDDGLPVEPRTRRVAAGLSDAYFDDMHVGGTHVRVLTAPLEPGLAIQIARPLDEVDRTLRRLAFILVGFSVAGIGVAGALGGIVTQTALQPVRRLTEATEHVTSTGDLTRRIDAARRDELGRLAASFNTMLAALESSLETQRQLIVDASHELRTPLTSLRTNVEVLGRAEELPAGERERLLRDVVLQTEELTTLVADLVELARGNDAQEDVEDVRLDVLVEEAVERARRHAPSVRFAVDVEPSVVRGVPRRLARAIGNLLDNAAKWSPPDGVVEVQSRAGTVIVRDHGAGIADADLPHIFDRFYRSPAARSLPGSGLGLAIVRDVAEAHGGTVTAERPDGGGALFRLDLSPTS